MNLREQMLQDGYLVFPGVVPPDLCQRAADIINATTPEPCFEWKDPVATEFRAWGQGFLEAKGLDFHGWQAGIGIFNRRPGTDYQYWHDDDSFNHPFYKSGVESPGRRVFACTYFTDTFNGRAPLRVIKNSHHGGYEAFRIRFTTMRLESSEVAPRPPYTEHELYTGNILLDYPDLFSSHPDEIVLEVPAGSMVVCDERILHGTPVNSHSERRPMALWWLEKNQADRHREAEFAALAGIA